MILPIRRPSLLEGDLHGPQCCGSISQIYEVGTRIQSDVKVLSALGAHLDVSRTMGVGHPSWLCPSGSIPKWLNPKDISTWKGAVKPYKMRWFDWIADVGLKSPHSLRNTLLSEGSLLQFFVFHNVLLLVSEFKMLVFKCSVFCTHHLLKGGCFVSLPLHHRRKERKKTAKNLGEDVIS